MGTSLILRTWYDPKTAFQKPAPAATYKTEWSGVIEYSATKQKLNSTFIAGKQSAVVTCRYEIREPSGAADITSTMSMNAAKGMFRFVRGIVFVVSLNSIALKTVDHRIGSVWAASSISLEEVGAWSYARTTRCTWAVVVFMPLWLYRVASYTPGTSWLQTTVQHSFELCVSVQHLSADVTTLACEDFSQMFWTRSTPPLDDFPAGILWS